MQSQKHISQNLPSGTQQRTGRGRTGANRIILGTRLLIILTTKQSFIVHIPRRAIVQRSGVLKVCRAISERYEWLSQVSTSNHPCPRSFSAFKQQLDVRFPRGSIVHAKVTTTHNHSCHDSHNHSCWSYHRYRFIFPPSTNHFRTLSLLYYSQAKPWFPRLIKSMPIHHLAVPVSFLYLWNKFPPISSPQ